MSRVCKMLGLVPGRWGAASLEPEPGKEAGKGKAGCRASGSREPLQSRSLEPGRGSGLGFLG